MEIRRARREDVESIARLYFDTIHDINAGDYSAEQVRAWAPRVYPSAYWLRRWRRYDVYVAEQDGIVAGFAELDRAGHLDCFYVHHAWQRRGVGSRLMQHVVAVARKRRIRRLFADASVTALPFFRTMGFRVVRTQTKIYRNRSFKQFRMVKPVLRRGLHQPRGR